METKVDNTTVPFYFLDSDSDACRTEVTQLYTSIFDVSDDRTQFKESLEYAYLYQSFAGLSLNSAFVDHMYPD